MRSAYEQKEDIRRRMMDLEKKLAESEEERCKLEKTCDVLMRAFREEEKMHYKALNKKYEKFLEDCLVRSRRNDIILRSLCRIEDRSRSLYAKTERLKLLKDRYISYLKINEFKQDEVSSRLWRNFPQRAADDVTAKAVRWKAPLALGPRAEEEFREDRGDFLKNEGHNILTNVLMPGSADVEQYGRERSDEFQGHEVQRNSTAGVGVDCHGSQMNAISVEIKSEEASSGRTRISGTTKNYKIEGKYQTDVSHPTVDDQGGQESMEKLRKAIENSESECHDLKYRVLPETEDRYQKPNEISPVTVKCKSFNELLENNHYVVTSSPKNSSFKEDDAKNKFNLDLENVQSISQEKDIPSENFPKTHKTLPLGLDGIDYQNETYPESYYEQPVHHHNHTSIASDVILEEDETEQELEDEEKNISTDGSLGKPPPRNLNEVDDRGVTTWEQAKGHRSVVEPYLNCALNTESEPPNKGYLKTGDVDELFENVKSQESDSEKTSEVQQSNVHTGKSKSSPSQKSEKSQTPGKSNLIHMLESDSESFQIEHGDEIPGNEDSDFDFSFGKN